MSEDASSILLSYDFNGTRYILQTLEDSIDTFRVGTTMEESEKVYFADKEIEADDELISLVSLDGQIFAFQNGQPPREVDFDRTSVQNELVIAKTCNMERTTRFLESDISASKNEEHQQPYEIIMGDEERNLLIHRDSVNANDFVEVVTAFKCKVCPYTSQDRDYLLEHFQNIHINPVRLKQGEDTKKSEDEDQVKLVYMCGECSNCFPSIEDCREHMIHDHQLMDREAELASKEIGTNAEESSLSIGHSADHSESNGTRRRVKIPKALSSEYMLNKKSSELKDRTVKCTYRSCQHRFSSMETMLRHANCHVDSSTGNSFKCNSCKEETFAKWRSCSLHLWKKHQIDIDLLTCKICKAYKTATMMKLLTHMKVHSETRDYECPDCGKCFKQSSQLRNHRVMHIDRKSIDVPRWYTSKTCEMCGKTYADSKCLKNHMQAVHSKLRPYVCNVCGHSSARKAMLQMHLRQHTGDKPFNCELCEYKTGDHNSLRRHIMRHTGVRPYKCPHCPYSAIQSNSYKNHLRSKHPSLSGVFSCELCPFKTVNKESYVQHVGDHEKGLIKANTSKKDGENVEVFPGNIAAAQLIYSCLGAFSKSVGKTIEANLMSSSTSADGTSQTITIQIPSKDLEGSLPIVESTTKNSPVEQEDDETMHCFLKIPREEEENIDTGGITIPAEPEQTDVLPLDIDH